MGFYRQRILPSVIDMAMRHEHLAPYRRRATSAAEGRVVEIGVGSGFNLPLYGDRTEMVIGIEPSAELLSRAQVQVEGARRPIRLIQGSAEEIPLETGGMDAVVTTWTLCTIPNAQRALAEMRRVLRPGGRLLFVEHGRSPDAGVRRLQNWLTPAVKRIGGGCHLNRAIDDLITGAGFRIERMETGYMKGPKPMTYIYEGAARPA